MRVRVLETDEKILKVLKPNGRKRRIRISFEEINKYQVNQELELILAKRTGQILDVNLSANPMNS